MRHPIMESVLSTALVCALGATGHAQAPTPRQRHSADQDAQTVPNFTTVTDQAMRAPRPSDWLMYRGNYQGWGYSPLEQINKTNVKTLQLAWSRAMGPGPNQATPIVYEGVMYLASPERLDPGARCRDRRSPLGVQAPAAAGRDVPERPGTEEARPRALWQPRLLRHLGQHGRLARRPHRRAGLADRSRRHVLHHQFEWPDRRQRRRRRGQHLQHLWRLLRHRPRCRNRPRALAQRVDPAPRPARRRDLGRLAVTRAAGTPESGASSPTIPSSISSSTDRAASRPPPKPSARCRARPWPAPTRASRCAPRPARSSGGIRFCRATIGTRNAPSR